MNDICPSCGQETEINMIKAKEVVEVRGEFIEADAEYYKCTVCGEEFENTRGHDVLELAYMEYRRRKNLLQPNEIKAWRKRYGMTQQELSHLLGWGGATLSRYENGALQDEAHDNLLRLVMEPHNLKSLIEKNPDALVELKRNRLIAELSEAENGSCTFEIVFGDRLGGYDPSEYSGYVRFSLEKLMNIILFFCKDSVFKTKLNKLLFYADFKHFQEYSVSITGAQFVHLQYGPVPENYDYYFAKLAADEKLIIEEVEIGGYIGEKCSSNNGPDFAVFTDSELKVMASIKDYFKDFSAKEIRDYSHEEKAYIETDMGDKIPYSFANELRM